MSYLQKLKEQCESEVKAVKLFKKTSPIQIEMATLSKKEKGLFYYIYHYKPSTRRYNTDKGRPWLRPKFNKLKIKK